MKNILVFIACLLMMSGTMIGQEMQETRRVKRTFVHTPGKQIEVYNKYGMVHLREWDKDSIGFEILVTVSGEDKDEIYERMKNIDFKFINTSSYVVVQSLIYDDNKGFLRDVKKAVFGVSSSAIRVDYSVYLPKTEYELTIENKYGDVYGGDIVGKTKISVSYGKLKLHSVKGRTELNLYFADASISSVKDLVITSDYSEIQVESVKNLRLTSKSSTINVENIEECNIDSKRDNITFEKIKKVEGEIWSTTMEIDEIVETLSLRAKYGKIEIDNISSAFRRIVTSSKYTDITCNFSDPTTNYNIEITHRNSKLYLPSNNFNVSEELINQEEERYLIKGKHGVMEKPTAFISIDIDSGIVQLIQ